MMADNVLDGIREQSDFYAKEARSNRATYIALSGSG